VPGRSGRFQHGVEQIGELLKLTLKTRKDRENTLFKDAVGLLKEAAETDAAKLEAVSLLNEFNESGVVDEVPFETVWSLVLATSKSLN
jgi:hypothetical protein